MTKRLLVALLLVAAGVFVFSCDGREKPIRIGAVYCMTGSGAYVGQEALRGTEMAIDEVNTLGGVRDRPVELILEDDQTKPAVSVSAIKRLIEVENVQVVLGGLPSSSTLADAPLAQEAHVVLFSPASSNPAISASGDYIFRNWISDSLEASALASYAVDSLNILDYSIVAINNDYGKGLTTAFKRSIEERGGLIHSVEMYEQDQSDFSAIISKLIISKAKAVYLPGHAREIAAFLNQATERGYKTRFLSCVAFEDPMVLQIAGTNADGVLYATPYYNTESQDTLFSKFRQRYVDRYGEPPGIFAAHAYDAVYIICRAMRECGPSSDDIRNCLDELEFFAGVTGETSFDINGDAVKPVMVKTVHDGQFVTLLVFRTYIKAEGH